MVFKTGQHARVAHPAEAQSPLEREKRHSSCTERLPDDVSEVSELSQSVDRLIVNENCDERLHQRAAVLMRPSAACNILQLSSCRANFGSSVLQLKSQTFLSCDLQLAPVRPGVPDAPHIAFGSATQLPDSPAGNDHGQSPAACSLAARQHDVIVLSISSGTRGQQQQRAPSSAICRTASSGAVFDGSGKTVITRCPDPSKAQTRPSSSWDSADR